MSQFTDIMKGNASWLAHGIAVCQDDFELLGHEYQELLDLRAQYEENTDFRKELGRQIVAKVDFIDSVCREISKRINLMKQDYRSPEVLTDPIVALQGIQSVANQSGEETYQLKTFPVILSSKKGSKGEITILASQEVFEHLGNRKNYCIDDFAMLIGDCVNVSKSILFVAKDCNDLELFQAIPDRKIGSHPPVRFSTVNTIGTLWGFCFDDALSDATQMFTRYTEKNGCDIHGIKPDELAEKMQKTNSNVLVKKL